MRTKHGRSGTLWGSKANPIANTCALLRYYDEELEAAVSKKLPLMIELSQKDAEVVWELFDDLPWLCVKFNKLLDDALVQLQMPYEIIRVFEIAHTLRFYCQIDRRSYTTPTLQKEGLR